MILNEAGTDVWGSIPEFFGSIKTTMIELFDDRYAAFSEVVVAATTAAVAAMGIYRERSFHYRDFDNTKPMKFDGVRGPIMEMRWLLIWRVVSSHVLVLLTRR